MTTKLSLYRDCLSDDVDAMDGDALRAACRKFKWFPSIAELSDFLAEHRRDRRPSSAPASDGVPPAIVNSIARLAMRSWRPPQGLGFWGEKQWEEWALRLACDAARNGYLRAAKEWKDGALSLTLLDDMPQPVPSEELLDAWRSAKGYA